MIPGPECGPIVPCCEQWFDLADDLRNHVLRSLVECWDSDECMGDLNSYVSWGEPQNPLSNYLSTYLIAINPTASRTLPRLQATLAVKLVESGWPMPSAEGAQVNVPGERELHQAAGHFLGHVERVVRSTRAWCQKDAGRSFLGALPAARSGGSVGIVITVNTVLP